MLFMKYNYDSMRIKKLFLTNILITILTISSFGQSNENLNKKTYFGFYAGYGFINPADVNEQLDIYAANKGIEFKKGNSHINFAYVLGVSLNHFVVKNLEIKSDFEFAWGVKQIKVLSGNGYINSLIRLSGGLYGNYHYFFENTNSVYLGGGLNYNSLILSAFDESITGKSSPIGYSLQIGYSTIKENSRNKKRIIFYELQYNLVKGKNTEYHEFESSKKVSELNFSGITLKVGYKF